MFEYNCIISRVVDGDTVDVDIDLGFGVFLKNERVRILGLDTPEARTSDPVEKIFGTLAKMRVEELLPVGSAHVLHSREFKGKFGRILGDIWVTEVGSLAQTLIGENLGVQYYGQNKDAIEAEHLENRAVLIEAGKVTL